MKLAHPLDHGLTALVVDRDAEGRILGGETRERLTHLLLIALGLGLDGDLDDRLGKLHALEHHRGAGVAQRVARGRILETGKRDDVARARLFDVLAVVGVHGQHAADALAVVLDAVEQLRAALHDAGIDAHEGQRPDERIGHDLEGKP